MSRATRSGRRCTTAPAPACCRVRCPRRALRDRHPRRRAPARAADPDLRRGQPRVTAAPGLVDGTLRHDVRVIFGDTDQMGVVYYANYLRYFEGARAAYWRGLGRSYQDLVAWGVALPVVEAHCHYRRSAYYEDLLGIDVWVSELRGASLRFSYRVVRG